MSILEATVGPDMIELLIRDGKCLERVRVRLTPLLSYDSIPFVEAEALEFIYSHLERLDRWQT